MLSVFPSRKSILFLTDKNKVDLLQVISQLLAGDEITVVADGLLAETNPSNFMADGYTSFTGKQIRAGLE